MHNSGIAQSSRLSGKHHSVSSPDLSARGISASNNSLHNKSSSSRGLARGGAGGESGTASFLWDVSNTGGGLSGNLSKSNVSINANTSRRAKLPLSAHTRKSGGRNSSQLSDRFMLQRLSGSQASLQSYLLTHGGEPIIPGIDDDSPRTQENKRMLSRAIVNGAATAGGSDNSLIINRSQNACASNRGRDASFNITNYRRTNNTNNLGGGDTSTSVAVSFLQQHPAGPVHLASHKAASYRIGIPSHASRILDAPRISNDFYLNIVDWGSHNVLAVALESVLHAWNAANEEIEDPPIADVDPENNSEEVGTYISSCKWITGGAHIAVGTSANEVLIYDAVKKKKLRTLAGHTDRVSSLAWNSFLLASGSRSGIIMLSDTRAKEHCVVRLHGHKPGNEICGLAWQDCPSPRYLVSGSNDNTVQVWSSPMVAGSKHLCSSNDPAWPSGALYRFTAHTAAVKALAFCPWHENLLATGGGSTDCTIKLWNLSSGKLISNTYADAPVAGIVWNKQYKELVSGHGLKQTSMNNGSDESTPPTADGQYADTNFEYSSSNEIPIGQKKNPITLWKYPAMEKMRELYGHPNRIIGVTANPDRSIVVSASADETLKFWDIWPATSSNNSSEEANSQGSGKTIRNMSDENAGSENNLSAALSKMSMNRIR